MLLKLTPRRIEAFLEFLSRTGCVTHACAAVDIARDKVYRRRKVDPEFAQRWAEARALGFAACEDELLRRVLEGVEVPVYFKGQQCATVRRFNDTLLIFALNRLRPDKYRWRTPGKVPLAASGLAAGPFAALTISFPDAPCAAAQPT